MTPNLTDNLKEFMRYSTERHKILSGNLSRANIPKAKAMDLPNFGKALRAGRPLKMAVTSPLHIKEKRATNLYRAILDKSADIHTPNGNNIDLFQQSSKMEENNNMFKTVKELYQKYNKLQKIAIGNKE